MDIQCTFTLERRYRKQKQKSKSQIRYTTYWWILKRYCNKIEIRIDAECIQVAEPIKYSLEIYI